MGGDGVGLGFTRRVCSPTGPRHTSRAAGRQGRPLCSSMQQQGQAPALVMLGPCLQAPCPFESRREAESGGLEQPQSSMGSKTKSREATS